MRGWFRTAFRRWVFPRHPHVLRVRDITGAYRELSVASVLLDDQFRVVLALDGSEPVLLPPLQVGWLRRQLREDVLAGAAAVGASRDQVRAQP